MNEVVKVRGETYTIVAAKNMSHLGSRFFGKVQFTLRAADGTQFLARGKVGKLPAHNTRLFPVAPFGEDPQ